MELTASAQWLNSTFSGIDRWVFSFWHTAAENYGSVLTPLMKFISLTAKDGIFLIILSLLLISMPKSRRVGVHTLLSITLGALMTNVVLKGLIARPRPFNINDEFYNWWVCVGSNMENGRSFPSGHVTAATAFSVAAALSSGKKYVWFLSIGYIVLMCFSRNYLIVHYFSDVLGAIIVGSVAGTVSFLILKMKTPAGKIN
jgi:undecaprenyl-diphosphatase